MPFWRRLTVQERGAGLGDIFTQNTLSAIRAVCQVLVRSLCGQTREGFRHWGWKGLFPVKTETQPRVQQLGDHMCLKAQSFILSCVFHSLNMSYMVPPCRFLLSSQPDFLTLTSLSYKYYSTDQKHKWTDCNAFILSSHTFLTHLTSRANWFEVLDLLTLATLLSETHTPGAAASCVKSFGAGFLFWVSSSYHYTELCTGQPIVWNKPFVFSHLISIYSLLYTHVALMLLFGKAVMSF